MQTSQMPFEYESMQQVPSKSDNGKEFKSRGKIGNGLTVGLMWNARPSLRLRKIRKNFDTGFEISFVGTMNISLYTQSEQPSVQCSRKALNETYEKRHDCCDIYSNSASRASKFIVGSVTAAAVAGYCNFAGDLEFWNGDHYRGRTICKTNTTYEKKFYLCIYIKNSTCIYR